MTFLEKIESGIFNTFWTQGYTSLPEHLVRFIMSPLEHYAPTSINVIMYETLREEAQKDK